MPGHAMPRREKRTIPKDRRVYNSPLTCVRGREKIGDRARGRPRFHFGCEPADPTCGKQARLWEFARTDHRLHAARRNRENVGYTRKVIKQRGMPPWRRAIAVIATGRWLLCRGAARAWCTHRSGCAAGLNRDLADDLEAPNQGLGRDPLKARTLARGRNGVKGFEIEHAEVVVCG